MIESVCSRCRCVKTERTLGLSVRLFDSNETIVFRFYDDKWFCFECETWAKKRLKEVIWAFWQEEIKG